MSSFFQLRLDAEEIRTLLASAQRQKVKDILTVELRKIETEITHQEQALKQQAASGDGTPQPPKLVSTQPRIPTVDVKNYGNACSIMAASCVSP